MNRVEASGQREAKEWPPRHITSPVACIATRSAGCAAIGARARGVHSVCPLPAAARGGRTEAECVGECNEGGHTSAISAFGASSAAFRAARRTHVAVYALRSYAHAGESAPAGASRASWGALCAARAKPGLQTVTGFPHWGAPSISNQAGDPSILNQDGESSAWLAVRAIPQSRTKPR